MDIDTHFVSKDSLSVFDNKETACYESMRRFKEYIRNLRTEYKEIKEILEFAEKRIKKYNYNHGIFE